MSIVLLGNIIALIGAAIMVGAGLLKRKNQILIAQIIQFIIMGVGNLVLGGVTGFVANIVSIFRNLYVFKWKLNIPVKIAFIAVQVFITGYFNTQGIIGWLPAIAAGLFTWFVDTDSEVKLKTVIVITMVFWCIFDFYIMNFTALVFDVLTIVSNIMGIHLVKKKTR